jgi:hypothetical protein
VKAYRPSQEREPSRGGYGRQQRGKFQNNRNGNGGGNNRNDNRNDKRNGGGGNQKFGKKRF